MQYFSEDICYGIVGFGHKIIQN